MSVINSDVKQLFVLAGFALRFVGYPDKPKGVDNGYVFQLSDLNTKDGESIISFEDFVLAVNGLVKEGYLSGVENYDDRFVSYWLSEDGGFIGRGVRRAYIECTLGKITLLEFGFYDLFIRGLAMTCDCTAKTNCYKLRKDLIEFLVDASSSLFQSEDKHLSESEVIDLINKFIREMYVTTYPSSPNFFGTLSIDNIETWVLIRAC